jgi:hypothetical protein
VFESEKQAQTVVCRSLLQVGSMKLSCCCLLLRYDCSLLGRLYSGQDLRLHFLIGTGLAVDTDA